MAAKRKTASKAGARKTSVKRKSAGKAKKTGARKSKKGGARKSAKKGKAAKKKQAGFSFWA